MTDLKSRMRDQARAVRARCDPARGMWMAHRVLASGLIRPGAVIAGTWPLGSEIDVRPLLLALCGRGHTLALPHTPPRGQALTFHRWRPGTPLRAERFGTMRPAQDDPIVPDTLLVPLLAFDAGCARLGYGGGYYDRTLAGLPDAVTIGCAFAAQRVDAVPTLPFDVRLGAVATEAGLWIR